MASPGQLIAVAAGGNSLIEDETKQAFRDQYAAVERTSCQLDPQDAIGCQALLARYDGRTIAGQTGTLALP